jgi:hypothetical protein
MFHDRRRRHELAARTRYCKMSDGCFLGLQSDYDRTVHRREIGDQLKAIRPRAA